MIRRPPRSTLSFPTRRSSDLGETVDVELTPDAPGDLRVEARRSPGASGVSSTRSEEHTSELQSPDHLVCRLLLEKKKTHLYTELKREHTKLDHAATPFNTSTY